MDNITRVCRKCGRELPLSEFVKSKTCASGYEYTCKQCRREYYLKWFAANPEKAREHNRESSLKYREKHRENIRKYYLANAGKIIERCSKWNIANPEKHREYSRKWRTANPEKMREYKHKYYAYKCEILSDAYLRNQLKKSNLPITPETIDYKRIQLKLYREIKNQQSDERD